MPKTDFTTTNEQLQNILDQLQQPDIQVDQAVKLYEQGLKLINELEGHLKQAENKISRLKSQAAGQ